MLQIHTGALDAILGLPLTDGSYRGFKGRLWFVQGTLLGLSLHHGDDKWIFSQCPAGPAVVCCFEIDRHPTGEGWKRIPATMSKLSLVNGVVVRQESPLTALLDISHWQTKP